MLILKSYKKGRSGRSLWEYKIFYPDPINRHKTKVKKRGGFSTKEEAERAAGEMLGLLRLAFKR